MRAFNAVGFRVSGYPIDAANFLPASTGVIVSCLRVYGYRVIYPIPKPHTVYCTPAGKNDGAHGVPGLGAAGGLVADGGAPERVRAGGPAPHPPQH